MPLGPRQGPHPGLGFLGYLVPGSPSPSSSEPPALPCSHCSSLGPLWRVVASWLPTLVEEAQFLLMVQNPRPGGGRECGPRVGHQPWMALVSSGLYRFLTVRWQARSLTSLSSSGFLCDAGTKLQRMSGVSKDLTDRAAGGNFLHSGDTCRQHLGVGLWAHRGFSGTQVLTCSW